MSAIITLALVRRYLLATGYRRIPWGWTRSKPGLLGWTAAEAGFHHVDDPGTLIERVAADGGGNARELCARLGMLAAAEMVREEAQGYEVKSADEDGPREALFDVASKLIEASGVEPKAWEKARGA